MHKNASFALNRIKTLLGRGDWCFSYHGPNFLTYFLACAQKRKLKLKELKEVKDFRSPHAHGL